MQDIITVIPAPAVNKNAYYAKARAIEPNEIKVEWMGVVSGQRYQVTVTVNGKGLLGNHWDNNDMVTIEGNLPAEIKGSTNRKARETAALIAHLGVQPYSLVPAGPLLDSINTDIANRVRLFNERMVDDVKRMFINAGDIWQADAFAVEKAKINTLLEARKAITTLIDAAREDLHAKGKAQLLAHFREAGLDGILPLAELEQTNPERGFAFIS